MMSLFGFGAEVEVEVEVEVEKILNKVTTSNILFLKISEFIKFYLWHDVRSSESLFNLGSA